MLLIQTKRKLLIFLYLVTLAGWSKASSLNPLIELTPTFQEYVLQLGVNPNIVINQLSAQQRVFSTPIDKAQQHLILSLAYNKQVHPKEALQHADAGLALLDLNLQPWLVYYLKIAKGVALDLLGDPDTSITLASEALEWAESNNHSTLLINALVARSLTFNTLRSPVEALKDAQRAYSIAPMEDPLIAKAQIAANIALVYEYRRQPKRAIPYFEEAVNYHRKHKRWRDLGDVLYGLGQANMLIKNKEIGMQQLEESIEVARKVDDIQGIAYGLKQLAGLEYREKNFDKAEAMFKEALNIFEQSGNAYTRSDCLMWLARIAIQKQQPQVAFAYLARAELLINKKSMASHYFRLQEQKSEAYEAVGDIEKAYSILKENYPHRIEMLKKQYINEFEELKNEFELNKLDNENQLLEKDNLLKTSVLESQIRKNRYLYLLVSLTFVICILLIFILHKARQSKRKFEQLSMIDDLTKLANRRNVFQMLNRQIALSVRHNEDLTVAVIDLDFFKRINDEYGHTMGDNVLIEFSRLCQATLRKTDLIGRIGGEEFLVALPKTNLQSATLLLNKLKEATVLLPKNSKHLADLDSDASKLSISIGITQLMKSDSRDKIFTRADEALYKAKENGRNQIQAA